MLNVLELFRRDAQTPGRIPEIARATGINPKTLYNLKYHPKRDPRGSISDKLREFYERQAA